MTPPHPMLNERLVERLNWRKEGSIGGRVITSEGRKRTQWESGVQERKTDAQTSVR